MTSPFPDAPRVQYENNPLVEVVCQVRFPTILSIEEQLPTKFQERIREALPLFEELKQALIPINPAGAELVVKEQIQHSRIFRFATSDGVSSLSLTRSFLALSTSRYSRYEKFAELFKLGWDALLEICDPLYATRIGLRYIDHLQLSMLFPENTSWARMLNPVLSEELEALGLADTIEERTSEWKIGLPNDVKIKMRHGLIRNDQGKELYSIDSDFFVEVRRELNQIDAILSELNLYSRRIFRWAISDELHDALGPVSIPESL